MKESFLFGLYWDNNSLNAKEYIIFSKEFLKILQMVDPIFHRFYSWGKNSYSGTWLNENFDGFEEIMLEHIDDEDIRYENPDINDWNISLEAKSPIGFSNSFSNIINDEKEISISISTGSSDFTDTSSIIISFESIYFLINESFINKLVLLSLKFVKPKYATLISREFRQKMDPTDSEIDLDIGWLTYFSDPLISQFLPAGTEYETLPEGGVLIKLKDEMPSADNPEDIHAAIKIRDSLVNHGITRWDQIKHKI